MGFRGGTVKEIICGVVQGADGTRLGGSGFTSVRTSVGNYTITFAPPLANAPAISIGYVDGGGAVTTGKFTANPTGAGFSVVFYSATNTPFDPGTWSFTAGKI